MPISVIFMFDIIYDMIIMVVLPLGVATIKIRVPDKNTGGRLITIQMKLDVLVEDLYAEIAAKLDLSSNMCVSVILDFACHNTIT